MPRYGDIGDIACFGSVHDGRIRSVDADYLLCVGEVRKVGDAGKVRGWGR